MASILNEDVETTYKDSNIFLKGTQSANPHNDYAQHFVDTGQRAQNFIRDVGEECHVILIQVWSSKGRPSNFHNIVTLRISFSLC